MMGMPVLENTLFNEILDFLVTSPTSEEIVAFRPSNSLQQDLRDLLERNRNGMLTAEEQIELDDFSRMNHFMRMLKIRAQKKLDK
jgi:hypothetical protein